jgi:RNA polymerase sigma factor (TIGR02999 family)
MENLSQTVTRLLRSIKTGEDGAYDDLLPVVYDELKDMAQRALGKLPAGQTLQATALVNEAYLRLASEENDWDSRRHFFFVAARAMRDILVDQARRKASLKRGGGWNRAEAGEITVAAEASATDLLALEEALTRLAVDDPEGARLVELRFFAGLSQEETARVLGVSKRTVQRDWRLVRARLFRDLSMDV